MIFGTRHAESQKINYRSCGPPLYDALVGIVTKNKAKEEGEWLRAIVPALSGPSAGEAWIRHVLRPIVEAGYVA